MDIEWAKDGRTGELFIVQARPETVQLARATAALQTYTLKHKGRRWSRASPSATRIAAGRVCRLEARDDIARFEPGSSARHRRSPIPTGCRS